LIDVFNEYVSGVIDGEITVGRYVRLAVERHLKDVERQGTEEFPYTFDEHAAGQAIAAFPALFRHTIGTYAGTPFELAPWQAFIVGSIWGWKDANRLRRFRRAYVTLARKNGKALSLDTKLPTPTGLTTMGEVKVGDYLIGGSGKPVMVEAVTEVMEGRSCLELEFTTGEKVVCDEQHEWVTRTKSEIKKGRSPSTKTAKEISETVKCGVARPENNHRIESVVTVGEKTELPIQPYSLGVWLGDGNSSGGRIYGHEDDMKFILDRMVSEGVTHKEVSSGGGKAEWNKAHSVQFSETTPARVVLREAGVLNNKHIPEAYFHASIEQRMALLSGLMDTDGTVCQKGQCEFTQKSGQLVEDVARLLNSLGVACSVRYSRMMLNGRDVGEKGRIHFYPPNWMTGSYELFTIPRKQVRVRRRKKDGTRKVVNVRKVESVPVKCVQVEGGTYLCGEGHILTHNSTLAAGICILLAQFDNEQAAQVFIGATKVDQAKLIFNEASRMIGASENLRHLADRRVLQINFDSTNSFIRPLGSDRAFDGLNPSGIIFDELHAWKEQHRAFYDTLTTGSASRSQPLRFTITTAGDTNSLLWIEEETIAKSLVEGTYKEDSYFAYIATLDKEDDPFDEANWPKSMPNLGISVSADYVREQVREAEVSKVAENRFKRYFANVQVSPNEAAIDLAKFDSCEGELSDWLEADVVTCGIDMGGRNDLAALAYCARYPDGENEDGERQYRYEITTKAYMDADTSRDLKEMPWLQWTDNGMLNIVPYVHTAIYEEVLNEFPKIRGKQVGFDPWSTQQLAEQLDQEGFQCIVIQQNRFKLHEPTTLLLDLIEKQKIRHNGDPILRWCCGNMVLSIDNASRIMPDKKNSSEKIDCAVAAIMALKLASLAPESPRGPLFIT